VKYLLALLAVCLVTAASAQTPSVPPVEDLMDPATFRAAGLHKLNDAELAHLNTWLQVLAATVLRVYGGEGAAPAGAGPPTSAPSSPSVIESRIDGTFEGWDGDTVFRLINGQVWQQATYAYHYAYAYMPRVLIVRDGSGYVMQVEGVRPTVRVRQLR
jgi:hypothetical protein